MLGHVSGVVYGWWRHPRLTLIQILLEIEKKLKLASGRKITIRECFDWIGGTSTGGVLALLIAKGLKCTSETIILGSDICI